MNAYDEFLVKKSNGFRPPDGPGRCKKCSLHIATQGHRDGCPDIKRRPKWRA